MPLRLLGLLILVIGAVLAAGGAWLLLLGGSFYYLPAGLALVAAGALMFRRRRLGGWIYIAVVAATVLWTFWEVGLRGWALVPRLIGPLILLFLLTLLWPYFDEHRSVDRRSALLRLLSVPFLTLLLIAAVWTANRPGPVLPLPADTLAMTEPSLSPTGADWPAYGGTYAARRYSPLTQINAGNVGQLKRVWLTHTGDLPRSDFAKGKYGAETTPLKVGDTLYLCTPKDIVIALDPATGKERWRYDPKVPDEWIPYTAACRGVAYYAVPGAAGPCAQRIIVGTLDARLVAVDARTGQACAGFGAGGSVDIKTGMGAVTPGMVSITSAPTIVRGVIVTGHQVLDGQLRWAPSGVILGYDAVTGALRWAWDMKRPGRTGYPPPGETFSLGTPNSWTTSTGDEALGLVYVPMGNSAADYWSGSRSALENQYAASLVALDVATGKPAWSFQTVHKDVWDYDLGSQATLVDYKGTPALVLPSKQGDLYVLDRRTGRPLTPVQERPAPQGGVEAAQRSPTQPHSLFHTLRRAADLTEAQMWGMSPIDQLVCRIQFRLAAYKGFYTPPETDRRWIEYPGYNGGSDWGGVAVDARRGVIVANYNDMPNYNRLIPRKEADAKGWAPRGQERGGPMGSGAEGAGDPQIGVPYAIQVNAGWRMPFTGLLCKEPPYGGIRAIDLATGRQIWDRPLGSARKNGPFGIPSMLPIEIGTPNNGGAVVTAGGVIFIAAATDDIFRAIDLKTGKTLWTDRLPAGGQATPMVYEMNGKEYVVLMTGGHHFMETPLGDEVIAYAL